MQIPWPLLIEATRMKFHVAKDRQTFVLTVESQGNPPVDIQFPLSYGPDLAIQLQNMLRNAVEEPGRKPRIDPKAN